jgi:UDP-N-acetylglucosamine 2-epimerase (non-hydrolysing)
MIDSLLASRQYAVSPTTVLERSGIDSCDLNCELPFGLVTLHRPSNVDSPEHLSQCLTILREVSERLPLICPLHPRTRANITRYGLEGIVSTPRLILLLPQGYLETIGLMLHAALVITDSGGIQEETTALGVPCLTMRDNTERPITVDEGTNILVGRNRNLILESVGAVLASGGKRGRAPELWDGHAAERIAAHLETWLAHEPEPIVL